MDVIRFTDIDERDHLDAATQIRRRLLMDGAPVIRESRVYARIPLPLCAVAQRFAEEMRRETE